MGIFVPPPARTFEQFIADEDAAWEEVRMMQERANKLRRGVLIIYLVALLAAVIVLILRVFLS